MVQRPSTEVVEVEKILREQMKWWEYIPPVHPRIPERLSLVGKRCGKRTESHAQKMKKKKKFWESPPLVPSDLAWGEYGGHSLH